MSVTQQLSSFALRLSYDSLPSDVAEYARLCFLDQVGVIAMVSQGNSPSVSIRNFVLERGGVEGASVMGGKRLVPPENAAWANGSLSVGAGLDGYHQASATHLLAMITPATMAAAEWNGVSGKDLIAAFVAGAEVMVRVSMGLGSDYLLGKGFHPTSIAGPFGAAICAGKLAGLSEEQLIAALGLAGVQAAGLTVWGAEKVVGTYPLQVGKACQSGVLSALLASNDYPSCEPIFEHNRGFAASHAPQADLGRMTQGLEQEYEIMNTTLCLYNAGILTYCAIDAFLMILADHPEVNADSIEKISVGLPTNAMPLVGNPGYPESSAKAHVSTRYMMAVTLLIGEELRTGMDPGVDRWRLDPSVKALFEKTEVHADTELDKIFPKFMPATVDVTTKDGRVFRQRFDGPTKGHPPNRLSAEDVKHKFMHIAGDFYGRQRAERLIESVMNIVSIENAAPLIADLCRVG